ncbi:hypothetical protein GCM10009539_62670 [Cryptosporangium japonicum]|uniref:Ribbon-helix-helix protein CopG domain-containing protein n=1 Tax=Cryptosporangium japonicum TaxID=80872 RepID=A0ABN0UZ55_9ACTN
MPTFVTVRLDDERLWELRRWATVGGRSLEDVVLAAIDEYITPVVTWPRGGALTSDAQSPAKGVHLRLLRD